MYIKLKSLKKKQLKISFNLIVIKPEFCSSDDLRLSLQKLLSTAVQGAPGVVHGDPLGVREDPESLSVETPLHVVVELIILHIFVLLCVKNILQQIVRRGLLWPLTREKE